MNEWFEDAPCAKGHELQGYVEQGFDGVEDDVLHVAFAVCAGELGL